jgi:ABC-type antimicrobial peptide transport system permease subunit
VGVVADVRDTGFGRSPDPQVYIPYFQHTEEMSALVRTTLPPTSLINSVKRIIGSVDPNVPVTITSMDSILGRSVAAPRLRSLLLSSFAGLALLLAAVGLYGELAYWVKRRTAEIGIRAVLGASPAALMKLVLSNGVLLALPGLGIGLLLVLGFGRLIDSFLFGMRAANPIVLLGIALILIGVALLSSFIPARRAAALDPMVALRNE